MKKAKAQEQKIIEQIQERTRPKPIPPPIISEKTIITAKIYEELKKHKRTVIHPLFIKTMTSYPIKFNVEQKCNVCNVLSFISVSKSYILDSLQNKRPYICKKCELEQKEKDRIERLKQEQEYEKNENNRIDEYISSFLNYENPHHFTTKTPYYQQIQAVRVFSRDTEVIEYIKEMDYYDFLKTLYWKVVARQIRKKYDFKCAVCNSKGTNAVHHRTYKNHGMEADYLEDLICLCQDCHEQHHNKGNENE